MNPTVVKTKGSTFTATTKHAIKADASGNAPARIQLIASGLWMESWKGNLEITISDLVEMKTNFDAGIGLPDNGSAGAPIDYAHADYDKAAGWIKALELENGILYASEIEWTPAAQQAIADGEWKFFSPSFYPACLGSWQDPENPTVTARNVLLGGGLTNIPFFKGLSGLKASQFPQGSEDDNTIYITADDKGEQMNLAEVRKIEASAINEEQKKFLADHRSELTADELVAFGLEKAPEVAPVVTASVVTEDDKEAARIQASIKSGESVLIKASEFANLQAQVNASAAAIKASQREKIDAKVNAAVADGRIKSDMAQSWGDLIEASTENEKLLDSLTPNPVLAAEIGAQGNNAVGAKEQIEKLIGEKITASREAGSPMEYETALSAVRRENSTLAAQYDEEIKG